MVLVLSQDKFESGTDTVLEWLHQHGRPYMRINGSDIFSSFHVNYLIEKEKVSCFLGNEDTERVDFVWFRRSFSHNIFKKYLSKEDVDNSVNLFLHLIEESYSFYRCLELMLNEIPWLSRPTTSNPNKLLVLLLAKRLKLQVPATYTSNNKSFFKKYVNSSKRFITKPVSDCTLFVSDNVVGKMLTTRISDEQLDNYGDFVFPSLIQEEVQKDFEIRSFYLGGKFYSMAIFSQKNGKTSIDFRNYDNKKPNRTVPYQLPRKVEGQLKRLLRQLDLDTASVDLIKDIEGNFVFLEVNPVGQFRMVSNPCNYGIEKKIFEYIDSSLNEK